MLKNTKRFVQGDTIIEVIFAVTIFSALAVSALSVMNRAIGTAQRSLEISLVRQEMNNQAEILRFIHNASMSGSATPPSATWNSVIANQNIITDAQLATLGSLTSNCQPPASTRAFVVNPRTLELVTNSTQNMFTSAQTYSQLRYNTSDAITTNGVQGIWVQQLRGVSGGVDYRDFHIRACWAAPGSNVPVTLSTIVRLYVPNN